MKQDKKIRCAIYTRKSTEEGLDQSFNSLHAQREACEAYIQSQRHEGWQALSKSYDDGGFSGGNIDRPGLKALLEDIAAKKIDTVVVYKVDRLTRSLADFAKIIEQFDRQSVSFVSVTQQFNTTTSMGRLTLNVLLSFAQFEREVTGERIRDKVAASKRKGMWMGGIVPLGYDVVNRQLVVNPKEADRVREIYSLYLKLGCVSKLQRHLDQAQIRSKERISRFGRCWGGGTFSRGALYELLQNRLYLGEVNYKDSIYAGQHAAILDRKLWEQVRAKLKANRQAPRKRSGRAYKALLTGLLYDGDGKRFVPTHTSKGGKRYHYYTSQAVIHGKKGDVAGPTRLPADEIEQLVISKFQAFLCSSKEMQRVLCSRNATPKEIHRVVERASAWAPTSAGQVAKLVPAIIKKVIVRDGAMEIGLSKQAIRESVLGRRPSRPLSGGDALVITVPTSLKRCGGEVRILLPGDTEHTPRLEPPIVRAVARAHDWVERIMNGEFKTQRAIARQSGLQKRYVGHVIRLAFLAPDLTEAILHGRQAPELTLQKLLPRLTLDWDKQGRFVT
jgi:site-specific DNA recombinase